MKKILLVACIAFAAISEGCKEIGPSVNLTPSVGKSDSVYSLTAAQIASLTSDSRNVLVEEFTGQACNNCPSAHASLAKMSSDNPGRINIIGMYLYGNPQSIPPAGSVYDFRDSIATQIATGTGLYGGISGIPSGGIDRKQSTDSKILVDRSLWPANIDAQKNLPDSINLSLYSSYNAATMTAKIVVRVTYSQPVSYKHNLTVALVEDGMIGIQEYPGGLPPFPSGHDDAYRFTDVFRDMISSAPNGDPVLDSLAVKAKGMVMQRTFYYKLKSKTPAIVPDSCRVIAFVNSTAPGDLHILQSAQTKLK